MNKKIYLLSGVIFFSALLISFFFRGSFPQEAVTDLIQLEPRELTFVSPFNEGDDIPINFQLFNKSGVNLIVNEILPSCGCMKVLTEGGATFESGLRIEPGSSIPVRIIWTTSQKYGRMSGRVQVVARSEVGNRIFQCFSNFNADVLGKPRAVPSAFKLSRLDEISPSSHRIFLCDSDVLRGESKLPSVQVSSKALFGKLRLATNEELILAPEDGLVAKFVYDFTFTPENIGSPLEKHFIEFSFESLGVSGVGEVLTVEVEWLGSEDQFYSSKTVTIGSDASFGEKRSILLRSREVKLGPLRVVNCPAFLTVNFISKDDFSSIVELTVISSVAEQKGSHAIELTDSDRKWTLDARIISR